MKISALTLGIAAVLTLASVAVSECSAGVIGDTCDIAINGEFLAKKTGW